MQLKPINQQVVAVVGASSGIGRKTALEFAKRGASLVVSARSQPGLESLVDEISQMGGKAVADAIVYVAEHPTRDIIVGDAGQVMDFTQRLSPRLMDTLLLQAGFKLQKTTEPKPEDAPDNLFEPISNFDRVEGDFSKKTQPSISTWLETHPRIKWGLVFTLGVAVLASYAGNT
jgi:NAD(P)-dependent dehydrogenase (short-subunit alcohol dehydrogenase family)